MKDKRIYLKVACILEIIYILYNVIYYVFIKGINDEAISTLFLNTISLFFIFILYKESKKDINYLKENKLKIIVSSIWLFVDSIIPGVLGYLFLSSLKDKKKEVLPIIKNENKNKYTYIKSIFLILFFICVMFVVPKFSIYSKVPVYLPYIIIFILTFSLCFKDLKRDFKIFISNKKVYFKFIIKRYFIMLGVMLLVAVPIVLINNGKVASNQQAINEMFNKIPLLTFILSVLYAPFVEEVIFRLCFSKIINNKTLFIIISGFLFGALHMIDEFSSLKDLLYIFQYSALGICLAKAYKDSNNIFVSISMHFIQNFLAALLVLILY